MATQRTWTFAGVCLCALVCIVRAQ